MLASEVITDVSGYLNDKAQTRFLPNDILTYLSIANNELEIALATHGISVLKQISNVSTLAVGTSSVAIPADMLTPLSMLERAGGSNDQFVEMTKSDTPPEVPATNTLNTWSYYDLLLKVGPANNLGALSSRDVKLWYTRLITAITGTGSTVEVAIAKTFLGKRTASLVAMFVGENPTRAGALDLEARGSEQENYMGGALGQTLNIFIREQQDVGVRRRSYHRPRFWRG